MQKHKRIKRNKIISFKCSFISSHSYVYLAKKLPIKVYTILRHTTVFPKLFGCGLLLASKNNHGSSTSLIT
jgi:hypothetical protein